MIGSFPQKGVKHLLACRRCDVPVTWFYRDKNGVDFRQYLGIVIGENPALLPGILIVKDTQADSRFLAIVCTPHMERYLFILMRLP